MNTRELLDYLKTEYPSQKLQLLLPTMKCPCCCELFEIAFEVIESGLSFPCPYCKKIITVSLKGGDAK